MGRKIPEWKIREIYKLFAENPDYTQKKVADMLGLSQAQVSYYLNKPVMKRVYYYRVFLEYNGKVIVVPEETRKKLKGKDILLQITEMM